MELRNEVSKTGATRNVLKKEIIFFSNFFEYFISSTHVAIRLVGYGKEKKPKTDFMKEKKGFS